ncbi:MAG: serine hydrolase [Microgenomates group bacterium]
MKQTWIIAVLFFMVGGSIGYGARWFLYRPPVKQNGIKAVRQSGYTLTNPLLECEVGDQESFGEIRLFRSKLQSAVDKIISSKKADHISVYFRDLNNGPWMGINEKEVFSPSSLLKVPLMMSVYQLAEKNPKILDEQVLYNGTEDKDATQNVRPSIELEPKIEYSYEQLVERMIMYSDNNAAKLLSQEVKEAAFFRPYDELGLDAPVLQRGEYYLKVKDYATFFRVLFNSSYLTREYSEKALGLLLKSEFKDGLVAGVPSGTLVAHKFGERIWEDTKEHQMHDCGIVYFPNNPYLLCVMTRGNDFSSLSSVIRDISKLVYDEIAAQRK